MSSEKIGKHKGALRTLMHEKKELSRLIQIVNSQMKKHMQALEEEGIDSEQFMNSLSEAQQSQQQSSQQNRANKSRKNQGSRNNSNKRGRRNRGNRNKNKNSSRDSGNSGDNSQNQDFNPL